jgi:hypothetical protein
MKTSPWYSTAANPFSGQVPVHHDNTCCVEGDGIAKNEKRYGTDNRPLCQQCGRLDAAGR